MNETDAINRSQRQWEAIARTRVWKGEPGGAIESEFVNQGLDAQTAKSIIDEAICNARSRATRLLIGSISFAALGLFVTIATYSAATSNPYGGHYWIWFGPVIAGGIASLIAIGKLMNIRR